MSYFCEADHFDGKGHCEGAGLYQCHDCRAMEKALTSLDDGGALADARRPTDARRSGEPWHPVVSTGALGTGRP